jgi:hypothetical protein
LKESDSKESRFPQIARADDGRGRGVRYIILSRKRPLRRPFESPGRSPLKLGKVDLMSRTSRAARVHEPRVRSRISGLPQSNRGGDVVLHAQKPNMDRWEKGSDHISVPE